MSDGSDRYSMRAASARLVLLLMALPSSEAQSSGAQYSAALGGVAEAMWELPAQRTPHAIMFLAHGCNHQGTDFWAPSTACPRCLNLPEERRIVRFALEAGYAVLAVTSQDRMSGCWDFSTDGPIVRTVLAHWRSQVGLSASLPLVALGASSGGAFVLQLPQLVPCAAIVSQIMAVPPSMLAANHPPTLFVHMPRDARTALYVTKCIKRLHSSGGVAGSIEVHPQKPTAAFFQERVERLAPSTAAALHTALKPFLDSSGLLKHDPRGSAWREALRAHPGLLDGLPGPAVHGPPDSLVGDASAVAEALNVAWAAHEIASDPMPSTLTWLADAMKPNSTPAINLELRA